LLDAKYQRSSLSFDGFSERRRKIVSLFANMLRTRLNSAAVQIKDRPPAIGFSGNYAQ
jgi:hypothetical protein